MPEARGSATAAPAVPVALPPEPPGAAAPATAPAPEVSVVTTALVLDDLPDGLVVVAADGTIADVNLAAVRLLGRPGAELVGTPVRRALPLQDTSGRRWWDVLAQAGGQRPTGVSADGHTERLLLLPGGTELLVTARYHRRPDGTLERAVLALRSPDERRRAESDAASLIATVAHELRSPLTSVKQFTASLLRRWDRFSDEQKRLMLTTVQADAERVSRLVGDLLDVARVDAGRLTVHRRPLDLVTLVREHVDRLRVAGYDDDRFTLTAASPLPELWADPDRIAQVVTNLVDNAVRHGAGTVAIDVAATAGEVVLTVDDSGEGVPAENRPYVFSKFWHGGQRSGTGLGLYVTRGLVEAHGGDVEVASSPAGGARFRVRLPAGVPAGQE
ncbi:PAS domain-containing sensor histidine kinase [Kineococcus vitellinus]|uniref:sensor histidine kinase n=1 Tax=Kineococcus vitellinus TaxID=2696565 RepID=UPI0030B85628